MSQPSDYPHELFPLAQAQVREWDHDTNPQLYPNKNIGAAVIFPFTVDYNLLQTALNHLIRVNEGLRLQFTLRPEQASADDDLSDSSDEPNLTPMQFVTPYQPMRLPLMDFSAATNPREAFDHWFDAVFQQTFHLIEQPMYEFYYVRIDDEHTGVLAKFHHIISDGYSISLLLHSLLDCYRTLAGGGELSGELMPSFIDYVLREQRYLNSNKCKRDKEYWLEQFYDLNKVDPHYLYKHPGFMKIRREVHRFDEDKSERLLRYLHENKLSLNGFFIAAMAIYHAGRIGGLRALIGTIIFNRPTKDDKSTIGQYISTIVSRVRVNPRLTAAEQLRKMDEDLMVDLFHQKYPYNRTKDDLDLEQMGYTGLFRYNVNCYTVNYLDKQTPLVSMNVPGCEVKGSFTSYSNNSCQLIINEDENHVLIMNTDYKIEEYSQAFIQSMHQGIEDLAMAICDDDKQTLASLMDQLSYPASADPLA